MQTLKCSDQLQLKRIDVKPGFEEDETVLMLLISEETEELLQGLRKLLTPSEFLKERLLFSDFGYQKNIING